ncbi:MAG: TldD/PmbA family protein [Candidatus Thorarchaeota archaeon]|nr:TldD/PmbA family protein [Candidatus Thorarchaeota archaeon]
MTSLDDLKSYVDLAVDHAKGNADGVIARGVLSSNSQIRFSQNAIDISKRWESFSLQLFLIVEGAKTGFSERSVSSADDAKKAVDDTIAFTKRLPESIFFAGVEENVHEYKMVAGTFDSKIDGFGEKAPGVVNAAIDAARAQGAKRVAGALKFGKEFQFFRSSYGPEGSTRSTSFDLNVRAFMDELDHSGQGLECGTKPSQALNGMIDAGANAGRLAKQAEGAKQGEPGTYDLVMNPTVAANVLGFMVESANPFMVLVGASPLGDKMGQQLGPEFVTVIDDARMPGGLASKPFDAEGTPTRAINIYEKGVLKSFVHNTSTGKMFETESTGSSDLVGLGSGLKMLLPNSSNIVFENGDRSFEELLEGNKPTIYVTSNWYTRFTNYQTGEFSTIPRDAMFLIEKREMKPIKNVRISDSMLRMFANISAFSNDRRQIYWWEVETPTFIPSVRIADCRITAATQ